MLIEQLRATIVPQSAGECLSHSFCSSEVANTFKILQIIFGSILSAFFLTLTSLSQPQLTMIGFCGFGENRTHDTHSVWPLSVMVNLQSPKVFHSLIVLSREPDTICLLSAEKETERTSFVWPTKVLVVLPVESSHNRRVLSHEEDRAYAPSEDITQSETM